MDLSSQTGVCAIMRALYALLLVAVVLGVSCADRLELNPQATIFNDVKSVVHNLELRQVVIELASYRRCNTPTFMVRLSGTSLYLLDLTVQKTVELSNDFREAVKYTAFKMPRQGTYVYSYPPLSDPGTYFLEVLVVYCAGMHPNDFVNVCVEDPQEGRNILTLPYRFEVYANNTSISTTVPRSPRWKLRSDVPNTSIALLPSRYQKTGCGKYGGWCKPSGAELPQYALYEWTDKPEYLQLLPKIFRNVSTPSGKVVGTRRNDKGVNSVGDIVNFCFSGASHSRELANHANALGLRNFLFHVQHSTYPQYFNAHTLVRMECSYVVIGYGQWMAGLSWQPFQAHQYESEMKHLAAKVNWLRRNSNMQIFFRSMNYNGYGGRVTACPPLDHRLPPVVDLYNRILRNISSHSNIEFIDTNHIMGPMWDSALDYQHPVGQVYTAEVHWILHAALNYSITNNQMPTLYTCLPLTENDLVRFGVINIIYINKNNKLHAFPSGYNYMGVGLDHVIFLPGERRKCAVMGPPIRGPKDYQRTERTEL